MYDSQTILFQSLSGEKALFDLECIDSAHPMRTGTNYTTIFCILLQIHTSNKIAFPVREWVLENTKNPNLTEILDSGVVSDSDRKLLVRIICDKLVETCGKEW